VIVDSNAEVATAPPLRPAKSSIWALTITPGAGDELLDCKTFPVAVRAGEVFVAVAVVFTL
jgi:hypothetical protein